MLNPYLSDDQLDKQALIFYTLNYDLITFLPIVFNDMAYLGDSEQKTCRFCGKSEPEVSFKNAAHIIPECTGNHFLASNYECDACNKFFGRYLESEYSNYFLFYHNASGISGKNAPLDTNQAICSQKLPGKMFRGKKYLSCVIRQTI